MTETAQVYARSMKTIQSVLFKNPFYDVGIRVILDHTSQGADPGFF